MLRYIPVLGLIACAAEEPSDFQSSLMNTERITTPVTLEHDLYGGDEDCSIYFGLVSGKYAAGEFKGIFTDFDGTMPLAAVEGTYSEDLTFTGDIDAGNGPEGTMSGDYAQHVFKGDITFPGVEAAVTSGAWAVDADGQGVWLGTWVACI